MSPPVESGKRPGGGGTPGGPVRGSLAGFSDSECVSASRAGDRAAQEELVKRYLPRVYDLLARCLGDRELAADATQEVFLRLFREIGSFDLRRSFRPWIFAIAWNLARDQLRRRKVRRPEERGLPLADLDGEGSRVPEPADRRAASPEEMLERKERSELLQAALRKIEPRRRALLILRELEGLSHEELSELTGLPPGTVKSGIHRARRDLRDALLELEPEWHHGM